jgi:alcohol dehydrogenase (NADP+)
MPLKALLLSAALLAVTGAQDLSVITPPRGKSIDSIPILGLGTFGLQANQQNTTDAIAGAIQMGYRHFDAAAIYQNERLVGLGIAEGLKRTGLKREDIWVTTKLWNNR